jgi:hypothetical protein
LLFLLGAPQGDSLFKISLVFLVSINDILF